MSRAERRLPMPRPCLIDFVIASILSVVDLVDAVIYGQAIQSSGHHFADLSILLAC